MAETTFYPCYCRKCRHQWFMRAPCVVACPACNSDDTKVSAGLRDDQILELIIKVATPSMAWMVQDMKVRHNQHGVPGNYSPELKRAIGILEVMEEV